jgi:hypothetical protein
VARVTMVPADLGAPVHCSQIAKVEITTRTPRIGGRMSGAGSWGGAAWADRARRGWGQGAARANFRTTAEALRLPSPA